MFNLSNGNISEIKVVQINMHHARAATLQLTSFMAEGDFSIGLLQEPYFYKNTITGFPASSRIFADTKGGPRAAIIVADTNITVLGIHTSKDVVAITLDDTVIPTLLISCYFPPLADCTHTLHIIKELFCKFPRHNIVLCGDLNAKHQLWGSPFNDGTRSDIFLDFFYSEGLSVVNDPDSDPTFSSSLGTSWIDVTLQRIMQDVLISDWRLDDTPSCSDHVYICFNLSVSPQLAQHACRYSPKNLNWAKVIQDLDSMLAPLDPEDVKTTPNLSAYISDLTDAITIICENNLKNRSSSATTLRKKSVPWWNPNLTVQRKRVRALRRRFQRCQQNEDLRSKHKALFKKEHALYKLNLYKAKMDNWHNFCTAISANQPFGPHTRLAMDKTSTALSLSSFLKPDGSTTTSTNETVSELLKHHFPDDTMTDDNVSHRHTRLNATIDPTSGNDKAFTQAEVEGVLRGFRPGKAPGPDGFSIEIIRAVYWANTQVFIAFLNECLKRGTFPDCWKKAKLILINKKGKPSNDPSAFRPICLLSIWSKVLDKLLTGRLYFYLLSNNLLNPRQYGFMPGKSTTQAIANLVSTIRSNKSQGLHTCLISLDVKGAFNNVWWPYVLSRLNGLNCPRNLFHLMSNYLSNRSVLFEYGDSSTLHQYSKGCPQGSNSGPLLWNIVADEALSIPLADGVSISAYADDIIITIAASGRHTMEANAEATLNTLNNWIESTKMKFCTQKTKLIVFPKGKEMTRQPTIHFQGHSIKACSSMKYLGIILDSGLSWTPHLDNLKSKCISITNKINGMSTRTWGLNSSVKKAIYKRGIERMILYACGAWWSANPTRKMREKLLRTQRAPLLGITKCFRTVSTASLQILAGVLPVDLQADYEAGLFRLLHTSPDLNLWNQSFQRENVDVPLPFCTSHPSSSLLVRWDVQLPSSSGLEVFTDGSRITDHVGAAFCAFLDGALMHQQELRLSNAASVFQAELMAIHKALEWILSNPALPDSINIFSDSQAALNSLQITNSRFTSIIEIRSIMELLSVDHHLHFHWIKSHTGITGNELADTLAKNATNHTSVDLKVKSPLSSLKLSLHKDAVSQWNIRWSSPSEKGRYTAKIFPHASVKRTCGDFHRNQILTNHGNFPHYFSRFNLKDCHCNCGQQHADALDILLHCSLIRGQCRGLLPPSMSSSNIHSLLSNPTYAKNFGSIVQHIMDNDDSLYIISL